MDRLGSSLRGALRDVGVPDAGALADVTRVWPETVGDAIARAAWPQRIARDGTLLVATTSSSWAFELGLLGEEILRKLSAAVGGGAPTSIRFQPGPVPAPAAPLPPAAAKPRPADDESRRLAEQLTAAMGDGELRETIARAAAASLARAASDRRF
jgi:predicted nucleic acid-binding Zn ribbon protein